MIDWLSRSWPPVWTEISTFLARAFETISIATLGTTLAAIASLPIAFLAARNIYSGRFIQQTENDRLRVVAERAAQFHVHRIIFLGI